MKRHLRLTMISALTLVAMSAQVQAQPEPTEIFCTIRDTGTALSCQYVGKDGRRAMNADDISVFVDQASVAAYMTVKSRRGLERTFLIDANSPQYRKLNEVKKSAAMSEISKAKVDLFGEIEKRAIKLSDDLDAQAVGAELIKYDSSVASDKFKRDIRSMSTELEGFRKNRDKICTSTPEFEKLSKANASLQQVLSNILFAFQQPGSCMGDFKVFRDKDGSVDLRQLDGVATRFTERCKK
jgi:hypothetical protein